MADDIGRLAPFGDHLVLSVRGPALTGPDRELLAQVRPYGVILFGENVVNRPQLARLTGDIRRLLPGVRLLVDFEGGRVNRFRSILGDVPAPAETDDLAAFGRWSADRLRQLDMDINLAPVVDLDHGITGNGLDGRYLGSDPDTVIARAAAYLDGLEAGGITGCLKHYPGLGPTVPDSHVGLPDLPGIDPADERPFKELAAPHRWLMVAHVKMDGFASVSTFDAELVARIRSFHQGPICSDDLSMKALPDLPLHEKVARVMDAGMDYALVRLPG